MKENLDANPILVKHYRGEVLESYHRAAICIVNEAGESIYELGDVSQVCYPRSALKYFQHIPLLVSGAFDAMGYTSEELALMCGSHNGEPAHVITAISILAKAGSGIRDLGCGPQSPVVRKDYLALLRSNMEPTAIHNNCSGKHGGFLAYCRHHKLSTEDYLSPDHPLQREIKKITAMFYEIPESELQTGVDGCSAPIFAMPIRNQAIAYKNLLCPEKFGDEKLTQACKRIIEAVTTYPFMLAGSKRYCSDLHAVTQGRVIGKTGADGVYSLAIPAKKWGICIKVDDGRMGPQYNIAQKLLQALGLINTDEAKALEHYLVQKNVNFAGNYTGDTVVSGILDEIALRK